MQVSAYMPLKPSLNRTYYTEYLSSVGSSLHCTEKEPDQDLPRLLGTNLVPQYPPPLPPTPNSSSSKILLSTVYWNILSADVVAGSTSDLCLCLFYFLLLICFKIISLFYSFFSFSFSSFVIIIILSGCGDQTPESWETYRISHFVDCGYLLIVAE